MASLKDEAPTGRIMNSCGQRAKPQAVSETRGNGGGRSVSERV